AANACLTLPGNFRYERDTLEYSVPAGFLTCKDAASLCAACRLFGMLNRSNVFAGNVSVQDATAQPGFRTGELVLAVLSAPKPRHKPFYSPEPEAKPRPPIRGRKFYYHRPHGVLERENRRRDGQNKTVEAVLPGAAF